MESRVNRAMFFKIILAFFMATIIFVDIFMLTSFIAYKNYQKINSQNKLILQEIIQLNKSIEEFNCSKSILNDASRRLEDVGQKLNILEEKYGKRDYRVLYEKELYSELELQHFTIVKMINKQCKNSILPIFFIYSNRGELEKSSEKTGFILTSFKSKNPEKIMIYSFDYDLNSSLINSIKKDYNITKVPVVIVNETDMLSLENIESLSNYLKTS